MQFENLPPPPPLKPSDTPLKLTAYELIKYRNIQRNNEKLESLNLPTLATGLVDEMKNKRKKKMRNAKQNEDELHTGPTTRLRASAVTSTEKGSTQNDTSEEAANPVLVQPAAQIQLPCAEGVGTMANYLAMQERKRTQAANDVAASGSGTKTNRVPETDMPFIENEEAEPAGSGIFYFILCL